MTVFSRIFLRVRDQFWNGCIASGTLLCFAVCSLLVTCCNVCVLYWSRSGMFVFCIGHVLESLCSVLVTCWNVCVLYWSRAGMFVVYSVFLCMLVTCCTMFFFYTFQCCNRSELIKVCFLHLFVFCDGSVYSTY